MIVIATAGDTFIRNNLEYINKFNKNEKICIVDNLAKGNLYIGDLKKTYPSIDISLIVIKNEYI